MSEVGDATEDGAGGHHFRWDLDKTYLRTDFDTFFDLLRTFRQSASDKRTVPGAARLVRELVEAETESARRFVSFISGSPRQMRRVLTAKLRLDGIRPDVLVLKPNLSNFLLLRFRALREQVGYKLCALLETRAGFPPVRETLFGDDAERDAYIYSLYGDLLAGLVTPSDLEPILQACRVPRRQVRRVLHALSTLEPAEDHVVNRIFIHLDRRSPPGRFNVYGRRVVPVFNYFQAALLLYGDDLLPRHGILRVADALTGEGYTPEALANSLQDLMRRGFLRLAQVARLEGLLDEAAAVLGPTAVDFADTFRRAIGGLEAPDRPGPPENLDIDYLGLADRTRYRPRRQRIPRLPWLK